MNVSALHKECLTLMPYRGNITSDFKIRLKAALDKYVNAAESNGVDSSLITIIKDINKRLILIVRNSLNGLHSRAYAQLQNLIQGKVGLSPKIDLIHTLLEYESSESFYRIRQMDTIFDIPVKELFHIPLDNRGIIKTQRYSMPGYPCIYLGESIYGCWEEMRRPPMHRCAVSRFQNMHDFNFIDLTVPKEKVLKDPEYLKLIPLIIASMIPTRHDADTYKPEYIIPQLIIEWLLKNRNFKGVTIHGIAYTSTRINDEFNFPIYKFINYAVPVFKTSSRNKYCKVLCDLFQLTRPTTNDIEKLKGAYGIDGGRAGLTEEEQKIENYNLSDFGRLEERLLDTNCFPLMQVNCKG